MARVVRQVGVHQQDELAARRLEAKGVGGAEAELARARAEQDSVGAEGRGELPDDVCGAVRGGVVDDDDLEVDGAFSVCVFFLEEEREGGRSGLKERWFF